MSIFKKTDFIQFGENLYEIIPPIPSDEERGGIKASSKTDAETIEAKLGDDGKLYVGADAKGSAAAALSLANENTQTKIDELSEAVDGKLAGKADTNHAHSEYCTESEVDAKIDELDNAKADKNHEHDASEIAASSPFENTQNSALDIILEDFDAAISSKEDKGHIHNTDTIKYAGSSGNIIGNGDTLTKILQGYDQRMTSAESDILNHIHTASNIDFSAKNFSDNNVNKVQSAIEYLDERIDTMNDELSQSIEEVANNKASATHEHAIVDIEGLQTKLDEKADSTHSHNQYATTNHKHLAADITYDGFTGSHFDSGDNLLSILETFDEVLSEKAENSDLNNKANKVHSHVSSDITDLQTKLDTTLESSKDYTDEKVALLLNNSSTAVDSIMELASAMEENEEVVGALEQAIGNKADKTHNHDDRYYTETEIDTKLSTKADASALSNKADKTHSHDDKYYTETEIDAMKESMVFIDEDDNEDIADPGSSATIAVDSVLSTTSINPVQNKVVKAALDNKCDKSYIADIFTQLKTALENSNIDGAIAVLDSAILDMTTLA